MPIATRPNPRAPAILPFTPEPLQIHALRRDFDGGETVRYFFLTWDSAEARHCARCPARRCNREDVPAYGTASCAVTLWNGESERFAAELGVEL